MLVFGVRARGSVQGLAQVFEQGVWVRCSDFPWRLDWERARVLRHEQMWVVDGPRWEPQLKLAVEQEMEYDRRARAAEAGLALQMMLD